MTMPQLQNCEHSPDGWCLSCVRELWNSRYMYMKQVERLEAKASHDSWGTNPDRSGGAFTQWEIDNANKW